jgi:hypothetical protein
MPSATQTIEFEGYFAEGVLGVFKIIRGFADLRDLTAQIKVRQECLDNLLLQKKGFMHDLLTRRSE